MNIRRGAGFTIDGSARLWLTILTVAVTSGIAWGVIRTEVTSHDRELIRRDAIITENERRSRANLHMLEEVVRLLERFETKVDRFEKKMDEVLERMPR